MRFIEKIKKYLHECTTILGDGRRKIPFIVCMFLLASMFEMLGIGLIPMFLAVATAPKTLTALQLPKCLSELLFQISTKELLVWIGGAIVLVFIIKALFSLLVQHTIFHFGYTQQKKLQQRLLHVYQCLPYEFHLHRNSASIIHLVSAVARDFTSSTLNNGLRLIAEGIVALAILTMLTFRAPLAVVAIAVLLGFVWITYDLFVRRRFMELGRRVDRASAALIKTLNHAMDGFKEIRVLGSENYYHQAAGHYMTQIATGYSKYMVLSALPRYLLETAIASFLVVLAIISFVQLKSAPELLATLGMFGVAALRLVPTSSQLISGINTLRFGRPAVASLYADIRELESQKATYFTPVSVISDCQQFETLELAGVEFTYRGACIPSLSEISFNIQCGDSLGLVGASGAGKSTLVNVVMGLLEPQKGAILFNGRPLKENLRDWLNHVAYLPQTVFLPDDTLRHNVALGIPDDNIDDVCLSQAIQQARLGELVSELPHGLNTIIGERGVRLSGGQRQRVALARAFYHKREVLVLDEATSALDTEIEREIVDEIKHLHGHKTLIVIAHRLSTVAHCDRILKLEHGRIVDEGNFEKVIGASYV